MEDGIEKYLYIIFVAIALIANFINKSKKKDKKRDANLPPRPVANFEDFIEDVFEKTMTKEATTSSVSSSLDEMKQRTMPMRDAMALEHNHKFKHHLTTTLIVDNNADNRSFEVELNEQSDWQKAFVYSEIFNRKY
ncbi:MAG: hypothetical protein CSA89_00205 [Bacteroidales bacterium]|nr:MAG: hypothetical protein CSA89_00205 [Bacteroidales bacterium]